MEGVANEAAAAPRLSSSLALLNLAAGGSRHLAGERSRGA